MLNCICILLETWVIFNHYWGLCILKSHKVLNFLASSKNLFPFRETLLPSFDKYFFKGVFSHLFFTKDIIQWEINL